MPLNVYCHPQPSSSCGQQDELQHATRSSAIFRGSGRTMTELCRLCRIALASGIFFWMAGYGAAAQGTVPEPLPASGEPPVSIRVALDQKVGAYKPIYSWFGYDEANYTTMLHGREL